MVAGEAGEYGVLYTYNSGTEAERTSYVYRIPAGTYIVTNIGEYVGVIAVCSDETYFDQSGKEETTAVYYIKALNPDDSDIFSIGDGQHIKLQASAEFILVRTTDSVAADKPKEQTDAVKESVDDQGVLGVNASELVAMMIEMTVSDEFDYYKIESDETGITLSFTISGITEELLVAKASGYDQNYSPWIEAKASFIELCDSIYDSAIDFGMVEPVITLCVLNDQNLDNVILLIMNGIIVYDVMAE